jgi:hypothetical protein
MKIKYKINPNKIIDSTQIIDDTLVIMNKKYDTNRNVLCVDSIECSVIKYKHSESLLYDATCNNEVMLNNFIQCETYTTSNSVETATITLDDIYNINILMYVNPQIGGYVKINGTTYDKTGLYFIEINDCNKLDIESLSCSFCIDIYNINNRTEYKIEGFSNFMTLDKDTISFVIKPIKDTFYSVYEFNMLDADLELEI